MQAMTYIDTATAVATSKLSYTTLRRHAKAGRLTTVPDPLDKRRVLWLESQLVGMDPSPNAPEISPGNRDDLATLRFLNIATAFQDEDRAKAHQLIEDTPTSLMVPLIEFCVVLAFSAMEDDVDAATPEQVAAAKARAAEF